MEPNSLNILAIDDNRDNLTALQAVVADRLPGARLLTALDGPQGLELAHADPDVILLDIVMPGMDGYAVCRKLKEDERLQAIPVIFLTALRTDRESRVKALEAGAEGFLAKPFDEVELTAQIRAMAKIKAANKLQRLEKEQLAALVAERTQELELELEERKRTEQEKEKLQAQLNQAQKMEAIGILAGGIAHDFNNILSVILGYTEMAREEAPPGSQFVQDLDKVLTSAHRAKDLVKQILAFSRQSTITRVPLQIQPLVKESLKMLRASIPTTITIKENIQSPDRVVLADPTQVHQIVMNLCTNAFHAMEKRGGVLSVAVRATTIDQSTTADLRQIKPGEYVELTVSDTGAGISPSIIDKIFDPYFTTKEIGKGTGLGLSISHGIIKSYGGAITVESTLGQGTTFRVYFSVVQAEARGLLAESQEAPGGRGGRILFVDDEELLMGMGRDMMERLGYTVTAHNRSQEALAAFMNDPAQFDLVITDQTMPGLTGIDLARQMLAVRPELPIILCTGFSSLVSRESAQAIGIRELAFKPLTKASIGQLARKFIDGQAAD